MGPRELVPPPRMRRIGGVKRADGFCNAQFFGGHGAGDVRRGAERSGSKALKDVSRGHNPCHRMPGIMADMRRMAVSNRCIAGRNVIPEGASLVRSPRLGVVHQNSSRGRHASDRSLGDGTTIAIRLQRSQKMPVNVVKTPAEEIAWERAKARAREQYPQATGERFYRIVMAIYKKMVHYQPRSARYRQSAR